MKSIFGILTIIVIITTMPFAFADIAFDQEVKQNIKIEIGKDANVHVIHEIADFGQNSAKLEFLDGTRSNFEIVCTLSCPYEFDNPEQIFEESNYMVFSQYPAFQTNLIVEYDLENVIELNNGLWKWEFSSKHNPNFYFDESITTRIIYEIEGDGEFYLPLIKYLSELNFANSFNPETIQQVRH